MSDSADRLPTFADAVIPFCEWWVDRGLDGASPEEQERAVIGELIRLHSERAPLLRAVLSCVDQVPQHLGLWILTRGHSLDEDYPDLPQLRTVYLRLVSPDTLDYLDAVTGEITPARALPPVRDPLGKLLPPEQRGNTLVAKVGNLGGNLDPASDPKRAQAFGGDRRVKAAASGRPLYRHRLVTRDPAEYSVEEAVTILRQWGYGIAPSPFRGAAGRRPAPGGTRPEIPQCNWLVEEVESAVYHQHLASKAAAPAKGGKAATQARQGA